MLHESWKQRLIRYANTSSGYAYPLRTRLEPQRTVLGQKLLLRKTMTHSINWLHKIKGEVRYNEPLSKHTSFQIGGPADVFILPKDISDLQTIFKNKGDTPLFVLGEGTNLLVRDNGFRGIVVCLRDGFKSIQRPTISSKDKEVQAVMIRVGSGVKMSYLAKCAARLGLSGIEGLAGVPGSLGGALIMNAGAEGTEIASVVKSITRITAAGEIQTLQKEDIEFHYRKTVFPPGGGIIVEAELELQKSDSGTVYEIIDRNLAKRSLKQPLTLPNSGSIFKNPPGATAGQIIESAGLKGFGIGDAGVSIKHANFIVNKGNASAANVLQLIEHVQSVVKEKTGIELETEIIVVGV